MYPFERFTEGARQALTRAQEEAVAANQPYIGTEHVALALVSDDGAAGRVLREMSITHEALKTQVAAVLATAGEPQRRGIPTSRTKRVIGSAFQEATSAGAEQVGTEHLLTALLVEAEGVAARALDALGVTLRAVRQAFHAPQQAGIFEAITVARAVGPGPVPGAPVGTSSSLAAALLRAGRLAREEGVADIRADHLLRAIAITDTEDLRGTLARLGLAPEAVVSALTVPEEIRRLGLAAHRAAIESMAEEAMRLAREYTGALSRWLGQGESEGS